MEENGAEQPRVYRHTRSMLKKRSTPTDDEQKAQMREWVQEKEDMTFQAPGVPNERRNLTVENSQGHSLPSGLAPLLPTLDHLPESEFFFRKQGGKQNHNCAQVVLHWEMHLMHQLHQEHASQHVQILESQPRSIVTNFTCKDTIATWISGMPVKKY